jgi:hypothetical protein
MCFGCTAVEPASPGASPSNLERTLLSARSDSELTTAADALVAAGEAQPGSIARLSVRSVDHLLLGLARVGDSDAERRALSSLIASDWLPHPDRPPRANAYDVRLVQLLVAHDDLEAARATAANIWQPAALVDMSIDRRFEPLWADLASVDAQAGADRAVELTRTYMEANPTRFEYVWRRLAALRNAGRTEGAVQLGLENRARLSRIFDNERGPHSLYQDADAYEWGIRLLTARALADAGQSDAAVATADYAELWMWNGDADRAMRMVRRARPGGLDEGEWASLLALRVCAAAQLKDAATVEYELGRLRDTLTRDLGVDPEDNNTYPTLDIDPRPEALQFGLLCAERMDEAAALMIARLEDEDERWNALRQLQIYARPPYVLPYRAVVDARIAALRDRPDVAAATERVGRILTWSIPAQE